MTPGTWTAWPRLAPRDTPVPGTRLWMFSSAGGTVRPDGKLVRLLGRAWVPAAMFYATFTDRHTSGWQLPVAAAAIVALGFCIWLFRGTLKRQRLLPSLGLAALLLAAAAAAHLTGFSVPTVALAFGCTVWALQYLPLAAALPTATIALGGYALVNKDNVITTTATVLGIAVLGYVLRLEGESRHRLRVEEHAARAAETESAALSERARIARDIHDVLAHSLSAQLVHLEAARLRIEKEPPGAFRDEILERVVNARSMARDGLAETRQALSALRGDMAPLAEYLREVAAGDGAEIEVTGTPRPVPAEASQTVRRVVQETLTNVRKHAPGARVHIALAYGQDELTLVVRDWGGSGEAPAGLGASGSGYGLLGMRERAELLGGTLEAGPEAAGGKGYTVRLRVPA